MKNRFPALLIILHMLLLADTSAIVFLLSRQDYSTGLIFTVPAFILIIACIVIFAIYSGSSIRHISKMNSHLESSAAEFMVSLPEPVAVIDSSKSIVWYNNIFSEKISLGQDAYGLSCEEFIKLDFSSMNSDGCATCSINGCIYNVTAEKFDKDDVSFLILYFQDNTDYFRLKKLSDDSHPNVVIITIDNYDDIMQNAKESEKAQASVETEKLIENFMSHTTGFIKKTSSNSFYAIIENRHMAEIIREKFKILDAARNIRIAEKYSLTFSIGVGCGADSLAESERIANQCLDMAMGRGGDQAVVKTENGYRFFGGVSKGVEKRSLAKSRIIANSLQDLIEKSNDVYIIGHRFGDLDSVGASCALAGAVKMLGKNAYVAVNRDKNLAVNLIQAVEEQADSQYFIPVSEAEDAISENDLLIIVDTHNKDFLESSRLYERARSVVVIDHHRKNVNFIDDAVIFHHEPYASSASEMVAELIQYLRFENDEHFPSFLANALLAGIMLDTKNFVMRTGVRTFEAAAYLKKLGADTVTVKGLFSSSIDSYRRRSQIVAAAKIHRNCAIAAADLKSDDLRLIAPQAADELLNITDVDASFVLYKTGSTVNISARSLGAMNVQIIMEQLGGGGHQTMAATQIDDVSVQEAIKLLILAIDDFRNNN